MNVRGDVRLENHGRNSIEAFIVGKGDDLRKVRALHRQFLDEFGLSDRDVPLLRYRTEGGNSVFSYA